MNRTRTLIAELAAIQQDLLEANTLRPVSEYHEDFGDVLWYHLPLQESPIVGGGPGAGEYYRNNGDPTACRYRVKASSERIEIREKVAHAVFLRNIFRERTEILT